MTVKLLTKHHLEFLSLVGGCTGSSVSYTCQKTTVGNHVSRLICALVGLFLMSLPRVHIVMSVLCECNISRLYSLISVLLTMMLKKKISIHAPLNYLFSFSCLDFSPFSMSSIGSTGHSDNSGGCSGPFCTAMATAGGSVSRRATIGITF